MALISLELMIAVKLRCRVLALVIASIIAAHRDQEIPRQKGI